jgi:hypothetical protein
LSFFLEVPYAACYILLLASGLSLRKTRGKGEKYTSSRIYTKISGVEVRTTISLMDYNGNINTTHKE